MYLDRYLSRPRTAPTRRAARSRHSKVDMDTSHVARSRGRQPKAHFVGHSDAGELKVCPTASNPS